MDDSDENLLLRWSRRKHEARQGKPAAAPQPASAEPEADPAPAETEIMAASERVASAQDRVPDEPVAAEDLPDLETLTYESDFSAFMREGVPELIKKQALRKLWLSNPLLANLDGLNEYDPINKKFLEQLEGPAEAIGEVSRSLRDKIMDAKRARDDRPRGRRSPSQQTRRPASAEPVPTDGQAEQDDDPPPQPAAETKRYDA